MGRKRRKLGVKELTTEVHHAYYGFGVRDDADWPDLPVCDVEDVEGDPDGYVFERESLLIVAAEMSRVLSGRNADILWARCNDFALGEIGKKYGIGVERVRQIEAKALRLLRRSKGVQLLTRDY